MTDDEKVLEQELTGMGYSLEFHTMNRGGYRMPSQFTVTVSRGNERLTTPYSKGARHRRWKKHIPRGALSDPTGFWANRYKPLGKVTCPTPKLQPGNPRNEQVIAEFNDWTEPIPPALPEVLWSLLTDAFCVDQGQTLDDFCYEFGYNPDSRKAEGVFNSCRDVWVGLTRLGADFEKLGELFRDY